jgi:hypothetical protein
MRKWFFVVCLIALVAADAPADEAAVRIDRVTTAVPFPRGLQLVDGQLYVLARGRVRSSGGVSAEVEDQAGTIYAVDPDVVEPATDDPVGEAVRSNGRVVARPTDPPLRLWDRTSDPPESDTRTDRPYCGLRYHDATKSFYVCAFSGIDLKAAPGRPSFSKNYADAVLRYDLRTNRWYELERHDAASAEYPHRDPARTPPPHGWLKGPDNLLVVGDGLYVVAKDNSLLVRYDLTPLIADPDAAAPRGEVVFGEALDVNGLGRQRYLGHSMLAAHGGYLYVGYRTSSVIVRVRLDEATGLPARPVAAELVARFTPWDPATRATSDLTDMCFDAQGRLYVISAEPAAVHRFVPDPANVYDGRRDGGSPPWLDLAGRLGTPKMKSENLLVDGEGRLYVTSGDGYSYQAGADGTVYRVTEVEESGLRAED